MLLTSSLNINYCHIDIINLEVEPHCIIWAKKTGLCRMTDFRLSNPSIVVQFICMSKVNDCNRKNFVISHI